MTKSETIIFNHLPENVADLQTFPEYALSTPFMAAALAVAICCNYAKDREEMYRMLDAIKGPRPLSPMEKQFLRDRLGGKEYVPFSYFAGTSPANNYEPSKPYTITVSENPYSYQNEGYATLYVTSSGADSPRPIQLRRKGDQWFLWELTCLADIRKPAKDDEWA